jgi:hypothetical protein
MWLSDYEEWTKHKDINMVLGSHSGIKIMVYWDAMLCSLIDGYKTFGGICFYALNMEAECSSQTLDQIILCYISGDYKTITAYATLCVQLFVSACNL